MPKKLMIFDCDGVLVNSENICNREMMLSFKDLNIILSEAEIIDIFTGKSHHFMDSFLKERLGANPKGWRENNMLKRRYKALKSELKPIENIEDAINYTISKCENICVASSSSHKHINLCLGLTKLDKYFKGSTYSAQDVKAGKPSPDVFLHALNSEGYEKEEAIIIEDSLAGAQAAQAAGIDCIGYMPKGTTFDLTKICKYQITSMKELRNLDIL